MDEETFRRGGSQCTTAWVGQLQQLVNEFHPLSIALPCVGANAGFVALKDMGHRGAVPMHIYDADEACRKPLAQLFGEGPGSPTVHIGPIDGDILRVEPAGLECPDGLVSGPPCQFCAGNGYHKPWSHPGLLVFKQVLAWIENFATRQLKFFVLENVRGISRNYQSFQSILDMALERLRRKLPEFEIKVWNLNSKDYTLAQHRDRIYIFGVRQSVLHKVGHRDIPESPAPVMPRCRLSWFLTEGLPNTPLTSLTRKQRQNLKDYQKLSKRLISDRGMQGKFMTCDLSRRPTAAFGPKFRVDDLVDTLLTSNRQIFLMSLGEGLRSPTVHRWLKSEERCRLQGFRPEVFAECSETERNKLTGNAFSVPCIGVILHYITQLLSNAAGTQKYYWAM